MEPEVVSSSEGPRTTGWRIAPGSVRPDNGERIGRKKGTVNKITRLLKDEILQAAELEGDLDHHSKEYRAVYDGIDEEAAKRGGRLGYLRWLARAEPVAFASLLAKVMPTQVHVSSFNEDVYVSVDQVREELIKEGVSLESVKAVLEDVEYRELPAPEEQPAEAAEPSDDQSS